MQWHLESEAWGMTKITFNKSQITLLLLSYNNNCIWIVFILCFVLSLWCRKLMLKVIYYTFKHYLPHNSSIKFQLLTLYYMYRVDVLLKLCCVITGVYGNVINIDLKTWNCLYIRSWTRATGVKLKNPNSYIMSNLYRIIFYTVTCQFGCSQTDWLRFLVTLEQSLKSKREELWW